MASQDKMKLSWLVALAPIVVTLSLGSVVISQRIALQSSQQRYDKLEASTKKLMEACNAIDVSIEEVSKHVTGLLDHNAKLFSELNEANRKLAVCKRSAQ